MGGRVNSILTAWNCQFPLVSNISIILTFFLLIYNEINIIGHVSPHNVWFVCICKFSDTVGIISLY